jgi:hypothetical protein
MAKSRSRRRGGHYPDHLRQLFLDTIDAFRRWEDDDPDEPKVEDGSRKWTLSEACGKVWNCTDILPSISREILGLRGIELDCCTYATAARALLARIKEELKERDGRLFHHEDLHIGRDLELMFA